MSPKEQLISREVGLRAALIVEATVEKIATKITALVAEAAAKSRSEEVEAFHEGRLARFAAMSDEEAEQELQRQLADERHASYQAVMQR